MDYYKDTSPEDSQKDYVRILAGATRVDLSPGILYSLCPYCGRLSGCDHEWIGGNGIDHSILFICGCGANWAGEVS